MIRYVASYRAKAGKYTEAVQYALDLANFYKKYNGPPTEVISNLFGETGVIIISALYTDFNEYQKVYDQAVKDPEFFDMVKKGANVLIEGTNNVNLWRVIEA